MADSSERDDACLGAAEFGYVAVVGGQEGEGLRLVRCDFDDGGVLVPVRPGAFEELRCRFRRSRGDRFHLDAGPGLPGWGAVRPRHPCHAPLSVTGGMLAA